MTVVLTDDGINALLNDGLAQFDYVAVGTGTPSASGLGNEIERIEISVKQVDGKVITLEGQLDGSEGVGTLTEQAYYTAESGGTLLGYESFAEIVKESGVPLILSGTITGADASS